MVEIEKGDKTNDYKGVSVDVQMSKSFDDVMGNSIFLDLYNFIFCFLIMYIYTSAMLNASINGSNTRFFLSAMGLLSVLLGIIMANGIMSAMGFAYMPHFAMIPFLMVGLGIDDMFVILQVFSNIENGEETDIVKKIGLTLKHAGVAISVTSLTDVCAFGVGAITVFPALQAFCLSCSLGIASIYFLQVTWFVAWLVIDEKRKNNETTGCVTHKCKEKCMTISCISMKCEISKKIWPGFSSLLESNLYHLLVALSFVASLSIGIWGCITIKQHVDLARFYPSDSYLTAWTNKFDQHFNDYELGFAIYTGALQTKEDFMKLDNMTRTLSHWIENQQTLESMDNWWQQFTYHINDYWNISDWKTLFYESDGKDIQYYVSEFLYSPNGGKYNSSLWFNKSLTCSNPAPVITGSSISITYIKDNNSEGKNRKRETLETFLSSLNTTEKTFSYGTWYFFWDLDNNVGFELWRNLGIAMICIFVVTLLFLNDFPACILVNASVIFTVVDVVGFVRFWGITIDLISLCTIVVVIGVCVDYPVHILHSYIVSSGNSINY